jgi:hypothetical protein
MGAKNDTGFSQQSIIHLDRGASTHDLIIHR